MNAILPNVPAIAGDRVLEDLLEKKRRRQIRSQLNAWARACGFEPAKHHQLINAYLEKLSRREFLKLMIFLPPGSAKSTYTSALFPPWFMCQNIGQQVLACSHTADLAASFGRRGRELISGHKLELGYQLAKHSQAADRWETTNGGGYLAAGAGAGIAGFRADLGLIDDPIGKKEDADSKLFRDKLWNWYLYDFTPRLKPNALRVLIQTRWHEDDLAGRLLASEASEWVVLSLPLLAGDADPLGRAKDELLWPEWFNDGTVNDARKDPRVFNCLYQQNPTPESGNYFERDWIQEYGPDQLPTNLKYYVGSDHAVSQKQEADSSVIIPVGLDANDNLWILPDVIWDKMPTDQAVEEMLAVNKRYRPLCWWAGKEHITQSIGPFLNKRMMEERNYIVLVETPSKRDLSTRAQSIKGRMRMRKVFFPRYATWWPKALHQLLSFPLGDHDDFIAALSEVGRGIDEMVRPKTPPAETVEDLNKPWKPTMRWIRDQEKKRKRAEQSALRDS